MRSLEGVFVGPFLNFFELWGERGGRCIIGGVGMGELWLVLLLSGFGISLLMLGWRVCLLDGLDR